MVSAADQETQLTQQPLDRDIARQARQKLLFRENVFRARAQFVPQTLSAKDTEAFTEDGYLFPIRCLSDGHVVSIREHIVGQYGRGGSLDNSLAVRDAHASSSEILRFGTAQRLLDCLEDLIGPNFVMWSSSIFCKLKSDSFKADWHQDAVFWPLSPTGTVTAWIALTDCGVSNGGMIFARSSHKQGLIVHSVQDQTPNSLFWQRADNVDKTFELVRTELKEGELSFHSDTLLHSSDVNFSDSPRLGVAFRYAPCDVIPREGWHKNAVLCRGVDTDGNWKARDGVHAFMTETK
jgi:non-haem Fe2+, alpha-ketoglutarate-dependent halogenase